MNRITEFFRDNSFRPSDIDAFKSKLFFDGPLRRQYLVRYLTLSFLATVIASYGILNDAPATVIGAMIIAPLMTPMMATAAALVMGDTHQDLRGFILVVTGVALVLAVSLLLGLHKVTRESMGLQARRHAFTAVLISIVLVSMPLIAASMKIAREAFIEYRAIEVSYRWLHGSGHKVHRAEYTRGMIDLTLMGEGPLPDPTILQAELARQTNHRLEINLKVVPVMHQRITVE